MARRATVIRFPKAPPRPPDGDLVEVRRCRHEAEALVVKGLLESEWIPCVLRSRLAHSVHPFTVGDQGEVIVLVPKAEAPRAHIVLARTSPGPSLP